MHPDRSRLRKYSLTEDEFGRMFLKQHGKCAICQRKPKRLVIDHDHATGYVRGLLCDPCNSTLGMMQDDVGRLMRAVNYLKESAHEQAVSDMARRLRSPPDTDG